MGRRGRLEEQLAVVGGDLLSEREGDYQEASGQMG